MNAGGNGTGIENIADIARPDGIENLVAAVAELPADSRADAMFFQECSSTLGGFDIEAQTVEPLYQRSASSLSSSAKVTITVP